MGTLYVVATPIGNLADMTFRGVEILKSVKYVAAEDTRHVAPLLRHYGIHKYSLVSLHKYNEMGKSEAILNRIIEEDCDIALVSDAGTPCISDPGGVLVAMAREKGIQVIGIPGASAMTLALSISGLNLKNFAFLGFFPRETKGKKKVIELMKKTELSTFVIYESPLRILGTVKFLSEYFPQGYGIVGNDLTKLFEATVSGLFSEIYHTLAENQHVEKGEYVIVIEPRYEEEAVANELSLEAQLINEMVLHQITMKEAIKKVAETTKVSKSIVYQASLQVKNILESP